MRAEGRKKWGWGGARIEEKTDKVGYRRKAEGHLLSRGRLLASGKRASSEPLRHSDLL